VHDTRQETDMASMESAVRTSALTKKFGSLTAVDSIDLDVPSGGVYGFLGPNGAGKTTTLRMLLGLLRPTSGSIHILGHETGARRRAARSRVGALIGDPAFYPFLGGRTNLRALAARARVSSARVEEVLEAVSLQERATDSYGSYSPGLKQRLGLAAAMLKSPKLLVLDEPTSDLDPSGVAEICAMIRALPEQGCTVLLSSRLLREVRHTCDTVGVISGGQLQAQGPIGQFTGAGVLHVVADPLDRARDKAERILGASAVRAGTAFLELRVERAMTPTINRALVAEGIAVNELRWYEPDLEDVLSGLTAGQGAVGRDDVA
jgi:ABC-2 type transport system ATP-binding protein